MDKNWLMSMGLTEEQADEIIEEANSQAEDRVEEARLAALEAERDDAERRAIAYLQEVGNMDLDELEKDRLAEIRAQALVDVRDSYERRIDPIGYAERRAGA